MDYVQRPPPSFHPLINSKHSLKVFRNSWARELRRTAKFLHIQRLNFHLSGGRTWVRSFPASMCPVSAIQFNFIACCFHYFWNSQPVTTYSYSRTWPPLVHRKMLSHTENYFLDWEILSLSSWESTLCVCIRVSRRDSQGEKLLRSSEQCL